VPCVEMNAGDTILRAERRAGAEAEQTDEQKKHSRADRWLGSVRSKSGIEMTKPEKQDQRLVWAGEHSERKHDQTD
jgi:hypothetical protein